MSSSSPHPSLEALPSVVAEAMSECLELSAGDRILVFHDNGSEPVMVVLASATRSLGVEPFAANIDSYPRPLTGLPAGLRGLIHDLAPAYTFYVAGVQPGELSFRSQLVREALQAGAGHVHMPKATLAVLSRVEGCRETARVIETLARALQGASRVEITSPAGTRLTVRVGEYRWRANTGVIRRGEWDNWPPGEVFTTPTSVEGVLVVDGVIGDYFSSKYGLLREPVTLTFEKGVATRIEGGPVARELWEYTSKHKCARRAGELGVGGNPHIREPIGNMLHDEKMPGAHIALGDPLGSATGAPWKCPIHVDLLPLNTTVRAGTTTIIEQGQLRV